MLQKVLPCSHPRRGTLDPAATPIFSGRQRHFDHPAGNRNIIHRTWPSALHGLKEQLTRTTSIHAPKHQYRVFVLIPCCQEIKYVLVIVQLWENPGFRTSPPPGLSQGRTTFRRRLSRWSPPRENARPASQRRQPVGSRTQPGWSNRPPKAKIVKWFCWCFSMFLLMFCYDPDVYWMFIGCG